MPGTILSHGRSEVTVPAGASIAVCTPGIASVFLKGRYANYPDTLAPIGQVSRGVQQVFGPYANGATIVIDAAAAGAEYAVGVNPSCNQSTLKVAQVSSPGALNTTGALTAALMTSGIVTSSTAAAVVGTLPTGAVMDAAVDLAVNDSFDWYVINTGANTFTVQAASAHTIVGNAVVAATSSGHFRTRKTAAGTFVTYRVS